MHYGSVVLLVETFVCLLELIYVSALSSKCCLNGFLISNIGQMRQSKFLPERTIMLPVAKA